MNLLDISHGSAKKVNMPATKQTSTKTWSYFLGLVANTIKSQMISSMPVGWHFICSWALFHTSWADMLRHIVAMCMMTSSNGNISALLTLCAGNSPVTIEFPAQKPVTLSFGVFFDLRPNKRSSKQSWGWWFETPSRPLLRQCDVTGRPDKRRLYLYDHRMSCSDLTKCQRHYRQKK